MKFRKKPVIIEAIQWLGTNQPEVSAFYPSAIFVLDDEKVHQESPVLITTLEGTMRCDKNDWIIKGVNGEFYPCKPDIFEKTYEQVC